MSNDMFSVAWFVAKAMGPTCEIVVIDRNGSVWAPTWEDFTELGIACESESFPCPGEVKSTFVPVE